MLYFNSGCSQQQEFCMESEKSSELEYETDVPYVPNIKPVIVPTRIGSNSVNLGGDIEAEIKTTAEADAEKHSEVKRKVRRFSGTQR